MQPTEGRKALYSMGGGRLSRTVPAGRSNWTGSRPVTCCFVCEEVNTLHVTVHLKGGVPL